MLFQPSGVLRPGLGAGRYKAKKFVVLYQDAGFVVKDGKRITHAFIDTSCLVVVVVVACELHNYD